jgi:hypothetical protein
MTKSRELAQELIADGKSIHQDEFSLVDANNYQTGETVVVIAIKVKKSSDVSAIKSFTTKMATMPYGTPCPCCKGSGRS